MTGVESLVTRIDRSDLLRLAAPAAEAAGGWFERRPHGLGRVGGLLCRGSQGSAVIAASMALVVLACSSAPPPTAMQGRLTVTTDSGQSSFCDNNSFNVDQGTQITVISPSGTVIGTGSLGAPATTTSNVLGCAEDIDVYPFQVAGLPSEPRYGVQINGEQETIWFTPAQVSHADLSLGGSQLQDHA